MRLYLSSFRIGQYPDKLIDLVGEGRKSLIIMNSCDMLSPEERAEKLQGEMEALGDLGFVSQDLDLREYFQDSNPQRLETQLRTADLLWVRGGNIFVLLRAMKQSGLDKVLPQLIEEDAFVYGGYSAGIDLLISNVKGVELVDDPNIIPDGYNSEIVWNGLGLVSFAVAPHYRSDHPESADVERLVQHYIDNHIPFLALRDGEVIVQTNKSHMTILGLDNKQSIIDLTAFSTTWNS